MLHAKDSTIVSEFAGKRIVREPVPITKEEPLKLELQHFVECVRARQTPVVSGESAKQAEIANISASGIGMFLDEKIEPGTILDLLLKTKAGLEAFDILACVVFLGRRTEGGWVVGCHFIRELEDADLKRLV